MTEQEIEETRRRLEAAGGIPGPRRSRYVPTRVLIEPEALAALSELAKAAGRSRNSLVREALGRWIKRTRRQAKASEGR